METIVIAISALIGGFMGSYFTRQTQHHKWLLERRAESFATFLKMLSETRRLAGDILLNKTMESNERCRKAFEAYLPVSTNALIVRLYLPKDLREEFYSSAKAYWNLHTDLDLGDKRIIKMNDHLDRMQEIFEQQLSAYFWFHPIRRGWSRLTSRKRQNKGH